MTSDPKQGGRTRDRDAIRDAKLLHPWCAACGTYGGNGHHVVPKGSPHFGDDATANIVVLCGSGTARCHGAFHGSPYVVDGVRRDQTWVAARVGKTLRDERPDVIEYVLDKLGDAPGRAFLARVYYLEVE